MDESVVDGGWLQRPNAAPYPDADTAPHRDGYTAADSNPAAFPDLDACSDG